MTAPDYAAMTDAQLDDFSAGVVAGSSNTATIDAIVALAQKTFKQSYREWSPSSNLIYSNIFLSHFRATHPGFQVTETTITVQVDGVQTEYWQAVLWRGLGPDGIAFSAVDQNRARAETICTLMAWEGMKNG